MTRRNLFNYDWKQNMLTTLIYRSQVKPDLRQASIDKLVLDAIIKNTENSITGILIYDGSAFFQVLEGEEAVIAELFRRIRDDKRHSSVVLLMQDYSACRRFGAAGMQFFNVKSSDKDAILKDILTFSKIREKYLQDERIIRLISAFLTYCGRHTLPSDFRSAMWRLEDRIHFTRSQWPARLPEQLCQFALQPIVEAFTGKVSAYEALIRSPSGTAPIKMVGAAAADKLYHFDLQNKKQAFALASQILKEDERLSVNLLPGVLSSIPGAVEILLNQITAAGLRPEQVIVEVTETEAITDQESFYRALKSLRIAGTGCAIDDFGAGYSGLGLLARFQPDKIKIDMTLIQDIHLSGVKQAIVRSIARCCEELGIMVVAEGVEKMEEWCWLESIGIHLFQGYLFSRPVLNDTCLIRWPVRNQII